MKPIFYRHPGAAERWMCGRKKRYRTRAHALANRSGHRPYRCPFCRQWHLTKS